jgi:hypothetical protein
MAIELFDPKLIGADLFCDGLGEIVGKCVLGDDGPAMVTDTAATADEARQLVLHAADDFEWTFDLKLQRWLCPDCIAARDAKPVCK